MKTEKELIIAASGMLYIAMKKKAEFGPEKYNRAMKCVDVLLWALDLPSNFDKTFKGLKEVGDMAGVDYEKLCKDMKDIAVELNKEHTKEEDGFTE